MDDDDVDILDTHNLYNNYPVEIIGVLCVCICGRSFLACMACLIDGMVTMCQDCSSKCEHGHMN